MAFDAKQYSTINSRGLTLIESMIAMAILSILILCTSLVIQTILNSTTSSRSAQSQSDLAYQLGLFVADGTNCTSYLQGSSSPAPGSIANLGTQPPPALKNTEAFQQVSISKIELTNAVQILATPPSYRAVLSVTGTKNLPGFGPKSFDYEVPVYYQTTASNVISSCYSIQPAASDCFALGGVWNGSKCDFCAALGGSWKGSQCSGI